MRKIFLLLTATITPKSGQKNLLVQDPSERLAEYCNALDFYMPFLGGCISGLIFAENSDYDLQSLAAKYSRGDVEWISTGKFDYPASYHRGYGEFLILNHVMDNSKILKVTERLGDDYLIIKVSGRYRLKNIESFVKFLPADFDFVAEVRRNWVELSVIVWDRKGWYSFLKLASQKFASPMVPEVLLAEYLSAHKDEVKVREWFYVLPYLVGRRGSDGSSYEGRFGLLRYAARLLRYHLKRLTKF